MSQAKRIRLAEPAAPSPAVEAEPSPQLLELVQDCTCPVCKEIYSEPVALVACGHAFCRRCYDKLCRKCATTESGIGGGFAFLLAPPSSSEAEQQRRVACPVCRLKFRPGPQAVRPDSQAECLVRALMLVKTPQPAISGSISDRSGGCCSAASDCWRRRAVRCTDCGVAACRAHHDSALASLRSSAADVAAAGAAFASEEAAGFGQLRRLADMRHRLPSLRRALADRLTARLDAYEALLEDASVRVRQAADASYSRRQRLADLVDRLESATAVAAAGLADSSNNDDAAAEANYAEMLALKSRLTVELAEARSLHPALRVEEPTGVEDLEQGLDACLDNLTVRLYALPYESIARASTGGAPSVPTRLNPLAHLGTRPRRPWCIRLLKNTAGLRLLDGRLVRSPASATAAASPIAEDSSQPLPECGVLLVNYSGPTGRLHLVEAGNRLRRLGYLQLQPPRLPGPALGSGRRRCRPGRIAVCNRRQLIFATDSGNNRVMTFQPTGRLIASFGCYGDAEDDSGLCRDGDLDGEPNFQRPLGLCVDETALYVVDSGNCRVQVFSLDDGYRRLGCLRHPDFTSGLHSVLVCRSDLAAADAAPALIVSDRDTERLFLFDPTSRRAIRDLSVGARPADLCSDQHGNILVSLAASRQVKVFDPQLTRCLYAFNLDSWSPTAEELLRGAGADEPDDLMSGAADAAASGAGGASDFGNHDDYEDDEQEDEEDEYIGGGWDSSSSAASSAFSLSAAPPLPSVGEFLFSGMDGRRRRRFVVAGGFGGGGGLGGPGDYLQGIALDPQGRRIFAADARRQCLLAYQL